MLFRNRKGQSAVEMGLVGGGIIVAVVAAMPAIKTATQNMLNKAAAGIETTSSTVVSTANN
jgi:Flp pilus assembly pilin Flp